MTSRPRAIPLVFDLGRGRRAGTELSAADYFGTVASRSNAKRALGNPAVVFAEKCFQPKHLKFSLWTNTNAPFRFCNSLAIAPINSAYVLQVEHGSIFFVQRDARGRCGCPLGHAKPVLHRGVKTTPTVVIGDRPRQMPVLAQIGAEKDVFRVPRWASSLESKVLGGHLIVEHRYKNGTIQVTATPIFRSTPTRRRPQGELIKCLIGRRFDNILS
jgi:hypothetical protein